MSSCTVFCGLTNYVRMKLLMDLLRFGLDNSCLRKDYTLLVFFTAYNRFNIANIIFHVKNCTNKRTKDPGY